MGDASTHDTVQPDICLLIQPSMGVGFNLYSVIGNDLVSNQLTLCRLCGSTGVDSNLLGLQEMCAMDGYSFSLRSLLSGISINLEVDEELEQFMPHCLCLQCVKTSMDFYQFVQLGLSFQRKVLGQIQCSQMTPFQEEFTNGVALTTENVDKNIAETAIDTFQNEHLVSGIDTVVHHDTIYNVEPLRIRSDDLDQLNSSEDTQLISEKQPHTTVNPTKGNDTKNISSHKLLTCPTCHKAFKRPGLLKDHLNVHNTQRKFQCHVCSKSFKYKRNLKEHIPMHEASPGFVCFICGQSFKQRHCMLKHEKKHQSERSKSYPCHLCEKKYTQACHLKAHILQVHQGGIQCKCTQCGVILRRQSSLKRHVSTVHAVANKYNCSHCSKGFRNRQTYQDHLLKHTGKRTFICKNCGKSFVTSKALNRHQFTHTGVKQHQCSKCLKTFLESSDLKKHMKRHLNPKRLTKKLSNKPLCITRTSGVSKMSDVTSLDLITMSDQLLFPGSPELFETSSQPESVFLETEKSVQRADDEPPFSGSPCSGVLQNVTGLEDTLLPRVEEHPPSEFLDSQTASLELSGSYLPECSDDASVMLMAPAEGGPVQFLPLQVLDTNDEMQPEERVLNQSTW